MAAVDGQGNVLLARWNVGLIRSYAGQCSSLVRIVICMCRLHIAPMCVKHVRKSVRLLVLAERTAKKMCRKTVLRSTITSVLHENTIHLQPLNDPSGAAQQFGEKMFTARRPSRKNSKAVQTC